MDLLNRVLFSLKQWKQPVIMIPGNHDQVGGLTDIIVEIKITTS